LLGINQRYFSSKKCSIEMFSAYVQEVNFKIFSLFYLRFCFGSHVYTGNSTLRICGVVPWHGNVSNIILLYTHTHTNTTYFLNTSLTTFVFTPLTVHTRLLRHHHEPRHTKPCWVLFQTTDLRYRVHCVHHGGEWRMYVIFSYYVKERTAKTEIFQRLS
jgi:hypothetical protein